MTKEHDGVLPEIADIAFALRIETAKASELVLALTTCGLLDKDRDHLMPHNWAKRPYESPGSFEKPSGDAVAATTTKLRSKSKGAYVYIVGTTIERAVKIGISKKTWARVEEFQTGSPEPLSILATFRANTISEADIHSLLSEFRQHREWSGSDYRATFFGSYCSLRIRYPKGILSRSAT